ncbi:MAG: hypothetical protein WKG07_30615 [Hymenobacter sp.]
MVRPDNLFGVSLTVRPGGRVRAERPPTAAPCVLRPRAEGRGAALGGGRTGLTATVTGPGAWARCWAGPTRWPPSACRTGPRSR